MKQTLETFSSTVFNIRWPFLKNCVFFFKAEIKHTVEILHEEQERVVKIEAIKKSLEIEVKNLSIRLEEVEANAIVGGKRIISKLEARIHDMEAELDEGSQLLITFCKIVSD